MNQREVTFGQAVQRALVANYCNFNGRSSRSEYWWYTLFAFILNFVVTLLLHSSPNALNVVSSIIGLALLLPGLGLSVRRLHDIGRSGWWVLINLVPIVGWIIFIVWMCQASQPTPNMYGPIPNCENDFKS